MGEAGGDIGDRLVVVYDGTCGFCNGSVRWLLRRDRNDRLRFVPFESAKAAGVLTRHEIGTPTTEGGSILVVRSFGETTERVLTRSDAVLAALKELPAPWPTVAAVFRTVPRGMRDWGYGLVASWRHRISGQMESCPVPTDEERRRFL